ncbi:hypothetical protein MMC22_007256 [Lobaria immixta]|nr:hypothetical protein [Lobaria immixta]
MEDFVDDVDDENEEAGTQGIYTPSSVAKAMPETATDVENRPAFAQLKSHSREREREACYVEYAGKLEMSYLTGKKAEENKAGGPKIRSYRPTHLIRLHGGSSQPPIHPLAHSLTQQQQN